MKKGDVHYTLSWRYFKAMSSHTALRLQSRLTGVRGFLTKEETGLMELEWQIQPTHLDINWKYFEFFFLGAILYKNSFL